MSEPDDPILGPTAADDLLGGGGQSSLLDAVDGLLERGVLLEGDLVLGLADVDLVYLRLSTLLAAADRILRPAPLRPPGEPSAPPRPSPRPAPSPEPPPEPARQPELAAELRADPPADARAEPARDAGTASVDALRERLEESLGGGSGARPDADDAGGEPARLQASGGGEPARWNSSPEDVERSVARLVLALVDFLRQLMERQAIRRMERDTLTEEEVERLGQALMRLETTVHDMARRFGLDPADLNLDLGPLGQLT